MRCANCSRENPAGSVYCQECGNRLGNWVPAEGAQKSPTPPTGVNRPKGGPTNACPRCAAHVPAHMRFCTECGYRFENVSAPAPMPIVAGPPASPPPAGAPAYAPPSPVAPAPIYTSQAVSPPAAAAPGLGSTSPAGSPPVCWRCRGVGEAGAEYCKFCGARFGDVALGSSAAAPIPPAMMSPTSAASSAPVVVPAVPFAPPAPIAAAAPAPPPAPAVPPAAAPFAPPVAQQQPGRGGPTMMDAPRQGMVGTVPPAQLVAILKDGSDGRVFPLFEEQTDVGRTEGEIVFGDDPYLSPRHARIRRRGETWLIRELDTVNGIYVRIREPVDLTDGDMILIGQQVLRFETLSDAELPLGPATTHGVMVFGTPEVPRMARLVQYTTEGVGRDVHYLYRDETVLGRENGDIVFTDDPFLSRRHAAILLDRAQKRFTLKDLGSSNGSAIRFTGERTLAHGDQFRIGRHLFRFDVLQSRMTGSNGGRGGP